MHHNADSLESLGEIVGGQVINFREFESRNVLLG